MRRSTPNNRGWDPGPLMQDVSALLRLQTELRGEMHELLLGQRELLRSLGQGGQNSSSGGLLGVMTTVFTSGSIIPQASSDELLDRAPLRDIKEDELLPPDQGEGRTVHAISATSLGSGDAAGDEEGSNGESYVEVDPDGANGDVE
eukprot:5282991-Amphidinium_carterae.1